MKPKEIKELIKLDDTYAIGALVKLYSLQTADEQMSNSTEHENGVGFNAFDAMILSDIAKYYMKKGFLSPKQIKLIKPKLYKYTKQLASFGFDPLENKTPTPKNKTKSGRTRKPLKRAMQP